MAKDNLNAEQLRFCSKLLSDLRRKTHWNIASPFYEPVGAASFLRTSELFLIISLCRSCFPEHPKTVKEPMDPSTMWKKLDSLTA